MDYMQVIFFDCGQGDMSLIMFPSGKTMLIDVCLNSEDDPNLDSIKALLEEDKDGYYKLDYLVLTHPHNDHIKNIKLIPDSGIKIQNIWESGHRLYISQEDRKDGNYKDYDDMLDMIAKIKAQNQNRYKDLDANSTPIINASEFGSGVKIYILAPSFNIKEEKRTREEQEKLIHNHCTVIKVQYMDNSVLFTGDSSYEEWRDRIVAYGDILKSTILHVSHHGSNTFFTDKSDFCEADFDLEHLEKISASAYVISVGRNSFGHPHVQALNLYRDLSPIDESTTVFITKEHGSFETIFYQDNFWKIRPLKFSRERTTDKFNISILVEPVLTAGQQGYPKKQELKFSLNITGNRYAVKKIIWQIQNNGKGEEFDSFGRKDKYHHELYYCYSSFNDTSHTNMTAYNGIHLIRCTAYDEDGNYATDIKQIQVI